jgi:hypothetical protein
LTETLKNKTIHWFRWYDRYPNIRAIINLTEDLSEPTQQEISKKLLTIVTSFWVRNHLHIYPYHWLSEVIPPDALKYIKAGRKKQRWYDQIPALHKSLNLILLLPHENRRCLDRECANLVGYIGAYKAHIVPRRTVGLPQRVKRAAPSS